MSQTGKNAELKCNVLRREATSRSNTKRNLLGKDFNVKGYYDAQKCTQGKVAYRSVSIELKLMQQFDSDPNVLSWQSPLTVKYQKKDGTTLHTLPDFLVHFLDGTEKVIEGKGPHLVSQYLQSEKYLAVRQWCSANQIGYQLVTTKNRCKELEILDV